MPRGSIKLLASIERTKPEAMASPNRQHTGRRRQPDRRLELALSGADVADPLPQHIALVEQLVIDQG